MNLDKSILEKVEQYVQNKLSVEERIAFEHKVKTDSAFADEVNECIIFLSTLDHFAGRERLKSELNLIHSEMKPNAKVIRMNESNSSDNLLRKFSYRMASIAAAVAAVCILGTAVIMSYYGNIKKTSTYTQLMNSVDQKISKSQNQIINQIGSTSTKKAATEGKYSGTGFLITSNGYLITSYHLVKAANSLQVVNDGYAYTANLISYDAVCDYALIKISDSTFENLKSVPYSLYTKNAEMGQQVFTLGYPRADLVYSQGAVSSLTGFADDTIAYQVSVPLNPGNSGSPLFDQNGNVVGVISGKQSRTEAAAFAIKSDYLLESLKNVQDEDFEKQFKVPAKNKIANLSLTQKIKTLKPYIFEVRVIN